jgi:hypothetical protein
MTSATDPLQCPHCGLFSPPASVRCDCGYHFERQIVVPREQPIRSLPRPPLRGAFFVMLPFFLYMWSASIDRTSAYQGVLGLGFVFSLMAGAFALGNARFLPVPVRLFLTLFYLLVVAMVGFQFTCRIGGCEF